MTFPKSNVVRDLDARESVLDSLQITIYDFFLLRILPRLYSVNIFIRVYDKKKTLLSVYYCRVISMEYSQNCLMIIEL